MEGGVKKGEGGIKGCPQARDAAPCSNLILLLFSFTLNSFYFLRVYFDADLDESLTNPGEWPWTVLIFKDGTYLGQFETSLLL